MGRINVLAEDHSPCTCCLVSLAAGVEGLFSPKLRTNPSNRAHYKQPWEGEGVLAEKTERSLTFKSTKAE